MPPRKEPKEQVVYPSSRAKTPAFKPLRRIPTAESQSSTAAKPTAKKVASKPSSTTSKAKKTVALPDSEEEDDNLDKSDAEEQLTLPNLHKRTVTTTSAPKRKASAISIDSSTEQQQPTPKPPSFLSDADNSIPSIPQPLLLRLLHEGFSNKDTKIDTHALAIVQKYMEVFVRETIARCIAEKKEAGERGEVGEMDVGWLELEDLEKVGVGMMLDF